jgi:hypothetical protein
MECKSQTMYMHNTATNLFKNLTVTNKMKHQIVTSYDFSFQNQRMNKTYIVENKSLRVQMLEVQTQIFPYMFIVIIICLDHLTDVLFEVFLTLQVHKPFNIENLNH